MSIEARAGRPRPKRATSRGRWPGWAGPCSIGAGRLGGLMVLQMFRLLDALEALFDLGFELVEDDFRELTDEEYACVEAKAGASEVPLYRIHDRVLLKHGKSTSTLFLCDEEERDLLLEAVAYVKRAAEKDGLETTNFKERMLYVRGRLPKVKRKPEDRGEQKRSPAQVIPFLFDPGRS